MPRVKRGTTANKHRAKVLKQAKGFKWGRSKKERAAKEALLHAGVHMFQGRKEKKRVYRQLWNVRINAAIREEGMSYSRFIDALKKANIAIDRKILAGLAETEHAVFKKVVAAAKK
jgi:large subunit ribosomal protein L20